MTASRAALNKDKEQFAAQMKEKVNQLEKDLKELGAELEKTREDLER